MLQQKTYRNEAIIMKTFYKFSFLFILSTFILYLDGYSQYASKRIKPKYEAYTDSLKKIDYNYVFPFWGQKAYKRGIDIQYPIGIMANYFWMDQGIIIDNFQLGFDNAYDGVLDFPLTPVSEDFLTFGRNTNKSYSINVRPDIWLFPFIDLYGIFGYGRSTTNVEVILPFITDPATNRFTSVVEQGITTSGFGVLLAGGVGPVWLSLDANMTWNKPKLLDKPTIANVVGFRMGKVFTFKNRPQSNISIWIGTMFVAMQSETKGDIQLSEALPPDVWDKKDQFVNSYWNWYNNEATPVQKKFADKVLTPIVDAIDQRNGESIVSYGMDKRPTAAWNGLVGIQYQLNKHWQLRSEGGVIGDRKSFLFSLNYRFLGFRKNPS